MTGRGMSTLRKKYPCIEQDLGYKPRSWNTLHPRTHLTGERVAQSKRTKRHTVLCLGRLKRHWRAPLHRTPSASICGIERCPVNNPIVGACDLSFSLLFIVLGALIYQGHCYELDTKYQLLAETRVWASG